MSKRTSRSRTGDPVDAQATTDPTGDGSVRPPSLEITSVLDSESSAGPAGGNSVPGDPTLADDDRLRRGCLGRGRLPRGSSVGRYIVLEELGSGGMGVVYAAFDPELDRKVAIKCMLPDPSPGEGRTDGRIRLVREAQAMARISHPNVIPVHDVGTAGETVFVAMELVDAETLERWLAKAPSLEAILRVFVQAGRGLAAAHAVDLIHRDFKPDNVLVDRKEQVRVVDFGLARRGHSLEDVVPGTTPVSASSLDLDLTATGSVMGTPAYMAPEQHAGKLADARSDQFAFCVALYEAVYGERPFAGARAVELAMSVLSGEVRAPPPGTRVPGWLRKVLLRGLCVSPVDRFPSMEALLRELSRDPRRRRRRWLLGLGGLSLGALVSVAAFSAGRHRPRVDCDPRDILDPLWNAARRETLARAFAAADPSDGAAAWTRAEARIDRYVGRWRRAYTEACEATHVHATQSTALLERRHGCLANALQHLDASLDVFADADRETVERTPHILERVPAPGTCASPPRTKIELPADPATRTAIEAIDAELIRADKLEKAQQRQPALALAESALAQAERIGHRPSIASAFVVVHRLRAEGTMLDEDAMVRAFSLALAAGDDQVAARVAATIGSALVFDKGSFHEGLRWAEVGQALIDRVGDLPMEQSVVDNTRGVAFSQLGRLSEAQEIFERMLEHQRADREPTPNLLNVLVNLGALHGNANELEHARRHLEEALEVGIALHGPHNRLLTRIYGNLANIAMQEGRSEDAQSLLDSALVIERGAGNSAVLAETLAMVALLRRRQGQPREAEAHYREALEVYRAIGAHEHPKAIEAIRNLAIALHHDDRGDEARVEIDRALALASARATSPVDRVRLYAAAAQVWSDADPERTKRLAEQAIELAEEAAEARATLLLEPLRLLGAALRDLGRIDDSVTTLERALTLAEDDAASDVVRAKLQWNLAQTYEASGSMERARKAAEAALAHLPAPRDNDAVTFAVVIEEWLAERR